MEKRGSQWELGCNGLEWKKNVWRPRMASMLVKLQRPSSGHRVQSLPRSRRGRQLSLLSEVKLARGIGKMTSGETGRDSQMIV